MLCIFYKQQTKFYMCIWLIVFVCLEFLSHEIFLSHKETSPLPMKVFFWSSVNTIHLVEIFYTSKKYSPDSDRLIICMSWIVYLHAIIFNCFPDFWYICIACLSQRSVRFWCIFDRLSASQNCLSLPTIFLMRYFI